MSTTPPTTDENSTTTDSPDSCETCDALTRRRFMVATAGAAALAATGTAAAQDTTEEPNEVTLDFSSDFVHDPRLLGVATVETVESDMGELEYIADDDEVTSLVEDGFILRPDRSEGDGETEEPHNPVRIAAANITADEFSAFPRGVQFDESGDGDAETAVEWHEADHWATSDASNGSISLEEVDRDGLRVSTDSVASGETVTATFDLSSVGASDATLTSGVPRKFVQQVVDVDALPADAVVEFAVRDSAGTEVTASYEADGDTSTSGVLLDATGDSQVVEARIGELEDEQGVELDDIQVLEIRVSEADADLTLHGLNLERSTEWTFGTAEVETTDDDGDTVVETEEVTQPAGTFGITSLDTLEDTPFSGAELRNVEYDVEARASELPSSQIWARIVETPDTYDRSHELEQVAEFETPSAYELDVALDTLEDTVLLPGSRFQATGIATGIADIDEWSDIEDGISWTDRLSTYEDGGIGDDVELSSSVSADDRNAVRHSVFLGEDEVGDARADPPAVVASSDGSEQGLLGGARSAILGILATIAGLFGYSRVGGE